MTAQKAANTQAATVPAPPPAAAAAAAAARVDPEKAKQLTQAVAEQVRLRTSNALSSVNSGFKF